MVRMIYAVESETQLRKVLKDVPLAIYISSTLSNNKNLGVLVSSVQLVHILLDKIPHLYVPLLESEGVFHEIEKIAKSKTIDESSKSTLNSSPSSLTLSLLRQSALSASGGRSLTCTQPSSIPLPTSNVISSAFINSRSNFAPTTISAANNTDLSLSSYLVAAAAAVDASNNSSSSAQYHLVQLQQQLQRHQQQQQHNTVMNNYHHRHILRSHTAVSTTLTPPLPIVPATSSSISVSHLQQYVRNQQSALTVVPRQSAIYQPVVTQSQQQQLNPTTVESNLNNQLQYSQTASLPQQQQLRVSTVFPTSTTQHSSTQIAQVAAAAVAGLLPSNAATQNFLNTSAAAAVAAAAVAQSSSYFNSVISSCVNVTTSTLTPSEVLMARAQAAFPNPPVSIPFIGQQSLSLFPLASQTGGISSTLPTQPNLNINSISSTLTNPDSSAVIAPNLNITTATTSTSTPQQSFATLKQTILERLQEYVHSEANKICKKYTGDKVTKYGIRPNNMNVLNVLSKIAKQLCTQNRDIGCEPLISLGRVLVEQEISAFQLNHSGITAALNTYLTDDFDKMIPSCKLRLRRFSAIFMRLSVDFFV